MCLWGRARHLGFSGQGSDLIPIQLEEGWFAAILLFKLASLVLTSILTARFFQRHENANQQRCACKSGWEAYCSLVASVFSFIVLCLECTEFGILRATYVPSNHTSCQCALDVHSEASQITDILICISVFSFAGNILSITVSEWERDIKDV